MIEWTPKTGWALFLQWIEHPAGVQEVMGSIPVGTQIFSLSHACVMLISLLFTFHYWAKNLPFIYHTHDDFNSANPKITQDACHTWTQLNDFALHEFS